MNDLSPGTRLGPYEILAKLGAGGMGDVYRARDTQLDRDVAIKVLPESFATDADRVARFTREAKTLAALNHPNIAQIYGVQESNVQGSNVQESKVHAIVMELVEGEDLSSVIARGALPLADALAIARQIADALEAAHEQGIIHRDLKPQNIKVREDGTVKVLDFGLAKAMDPSSASSSNLTNSPTMTSPAMTGMGIILGTAAYMSPEQAKGRAVDKRADIWAFGVVLYEMLTGTRAFSGEDVSDLLVAVLSKDVDFTAVPKMVPPALDRLMRRCLERDVKSRLRDIGEARVELTRIAAGTPERAGDAIAAASNQTPVRTSTLPWGIAGALAVALVGVSAWLWPQPPPVPDAMQFTISPPAGTTFTSASGFLSLSPDGKQVAFMTGPQADAQLWIRPLDSLDARLVSAVTSGWHVLWSPDMQSLVYSSAGSGLGLRRLDLRGGPVRTLATDVTERAAWGPDGTVIFSARSIPQRLMRVGAAGGSATPLTELDVAAGEVAHNWPVFLPDGRRFIFLARNQNRSKSALFVASLDSMERTHVLDVHSMAEVVPGYLIYQRDGTIYAHPFDEASARVTGDPLPIVANVQFNEVNGRAAFAASRSGHLVYRAGGSQGLATLSWLDRSGKVVGTLGQPSKYARSALSPDGRRLVVVSDEATGGSDLVMIDVVRNITSRFTSDPTARENGVVWSHDGESVIFGSNRKGPYDLYIKGAGGAAPDRLLLESAEDKYPSGLSPDGKFLLFHEGQGPALRIWTLSLDADAKRYRVFPDESDRHYHAQFSPDGRWIVYQAGFPSNVFVQPFPPTGYREQISATEGSQPRWTADGKQIAFIGPTDTVMVADVTVAGDTLRISAPRALFTQRQANPTVGLTMDARAERFLMAVPPAATSGGSEAPLTVIANWQSLAIKK